MTQILSRLNIKNAALLVLFSGLAALASVWAWQYFGYAPCELCLKQRWAYYAALPLAIGAVALNGAHKTSAARILLGLTALFFAANAILAIFHSGVEWGWWPGPSECTGTANLPTSFEDFQKQLEKTQVVRCDKPSLWVLGLTLSNWNFLISASLSILAGVAAFHRVINPRSQ